MPELVAESESKTLIEVLLSLVPENIVAAAAEGRVLPLIVVSLILGAVLTTLGEKGKPLVAVFEGIDAATMKIVEIILHFAPVGILALIGVMVAENRDTLARLASGLGLYAITAIVGLLVHAIFVLPFLLRVCAGRNPFRYFVNMIQSLATAFTTASSSVSLPVTFECVVDRNRGDSRAASFVLPLGATINMKGIGLIWAIDWFLDRCRTKVNVWGDSVGAAVIARTREIREGPAAGAS